MDRLNTIERECHDVLVATRELLIAPHKLEHQAYTAVMNRIRMVLFHLTNKEYGCPTGTHTSYCTCNDNQRGHSIPALKHKRRIQ